MRTSNMTIRFLKIAKAQEISMTMCSEKLVEFHEEDKEKVIKFSNSIKALNSKTKVIELISSKQHIDTKGNTVIGSRSLYLVDDDYYRELIGKGKTEQVAMF